MQILKQLLGLNACFTAAQKIYPKGIMVHSTGANNPRIRRYVPGNALIGYNTSGNHWDQTNAQYRAKFGKDLNVCVHAFIGYLADDRTVGVVQTLPYDYMGWHCGSTGNRTHLSFEICEDDLKNEEYFYIAMETAQRYCAYLMKAVIGTDNPAVVISHHEGHLKGIASNHADIDHWLKIYKRDMEWFRECVAKYYKEEVDELKQPEFNAMADKYFKERSEMPPSNWGSNKANLNAIEHLKSLHITDGTAPNGYCTREQVMIMLSQLITLIEDGTITIRKE